MSSPPVAVGLAKPFPGSLADDPVWAAALAAPPCEEPIPEDVLAGLEEDIADVRAGRVRMGSADEVRAALDEMLHSAAE